MEPNNNITNPSPTANTSQPEEDSQLEIDWKEGKIKTKKITPELVIIIIVLIFAAALVYITITALKMNGHN